MAVTDYGIEEKHILNCIFQLPDPKNFSETIDAIVGEINTSNGMCKFTNTQLQDVHIETLLSFPEDRVYIKPPPSETMELDGAMSIMAQEGVLPSNTLDIDEKTPEEVLRAAVISQGAKKPVSSNVGVEKPIIGDSKYNKGAPTEEHYSDVSKTLYGIINQTSSSDVSTEILLNIGINIKKLSIGIELLAADDESVTSAVDYWVNENLKNDDIKKLIISGINKNLSALTSNSDVK